MENEVYESFMIKLFTSLNPIKINAKEKIFGELDDVDMVIFVMKGTYHVVYEINYQENMKMRYRQRTVIGGFECSYN